MEETKQEKKPIIISDENSIRNYIDGKVKEGLSSLREQNEINEDLRFIRWIRKNWQKGAISILLFLIWEILTQEIPCHNMRVWHLWLPKATITVIQKQQDIPKQQEEALEQTPMQTTLDSSYRK